jgi:hypothetical protein
MGLRRRFLFCSEKCATPRHILLFEYRSFYQENVSARFTDVEDITLSVGGKKIDRHFCVLDFKNCFEQWQKRWGHCKELEGDYSDTF